MIGCSRHSAELRGALEIAGARSPGRTIDVLVAAASDLWLVDDPGAAAPPAGARLGGLAAPRIGDSALASALDRILLTGAPAGGSPGRTRGAATLPHLPQAPGDPTHAATARPAPAGSRHPEPRPPDVSASPGSLDGPGPAVPGSSDAPQVPPPGLPWLHLGTAAAIDLDRPEAAGQSLIVPAGSGAATGRFEQGPLADLADDRAVPEPSTPLDRGRSAPPRVSTPVIGVRSPRRFLREENGVPDPLPATPPGSGLAALVNLWTLEEGPATDSPPPASPTANVARSTSPDPPERANGPAGGSPFTAPDIGARPDPRLGELPGDDGAVTDLEAEALVLELLERALRGEARRHGVALETGGLV